MADKRASKPVQISTFNSKRLIESGKAIPSTTTSRVLTSKQVNLLELNEDYFNQRKMVSVGNKQEIEEENKIEPDDATVYHSIKEQYLNYRSSSQPNKDFLHQDST